ncbi:putative UPF0481 protein [Tanacetum coccineum]
MNVSFDRIVEIMKEKDEARIRACYHKFLDMSGDALSRQFWVLKKVTSAMSHLVDVTGKKLSHMAILRDLIMVENQIPLFLVRTMLEHQYRNTNKSADETLKSMLIGLYHELSPFQEMKLPDVDIDDCDHLLDFLYHMTVPSNKELHTEEIIQIDHEGITEDVGNDKEESFAKPSDLRRFKTPKDFNKIIFGKPMRVYETSLEDHIKPPNT